MIVRGTIEKVFVVAVPEVNGKRKVVVLVSKREKHRPSVSSCSRDWKRIHVLAGDHTGRIIN